jgi:hypothetical protein
MVHLTRHSLTATLAVVAVPLLVAWVAPLHPLGVVAPDKVPNVAGTYNGSITETEGSQQRTGSLALTIQQQGSRISGDAIVSFSSGSDELTISGTVKAAKKGAALTFEMIPEHGRTADAKATVKKKKLVGSAVVPASGSEPEVDLSFQTKKAKKD